MNLFYQRELIAGATTLDKDESTHALRVLRLKLGDDFLATDGQGSFYDCVVTGDARSVCSFSVKAKRTIPKKTYQVHIAIAPTKNHDRLEWFVEKAIEIGIDKITVLQCKHNERKKVNDERLQKVAVSAMKQSLTAWLPDITPITPFNSTLQDKAQQRFIAHLDETKPGHLRDVAKPDQSYLVLIGPEGDFSSEEISGARDNGFQMVTLGPNRLRTETAALVACHTLNLVNIKS